MQTLCAEDEFQIETTTKWIFGLGYPEVNIFELTVRVQFALSRRVGEKLTEAGVKTMHNTSPAYDSRSAGHAESGIRIAKENVRTLICFARELHGVTIGKSHVSLPWCVWLERHTEMFFSRSIRRVPKEDSGDGMLFNSIRGAPWELQPKAEGGVANRVQLDVQAAIPETEAPPPTVGEQFPRRVYNRRSVELARYGCTDRCIGCHHARLGLKPADHNEECRARIVRHMTADDSLNQRVQIAQDRTVEVAPPEARTGERDPVPEPARKKVRFAERLGEQTPEGTVGTNSRSASSSSSSPSSSSSSYPSSSQTAIAPSMQVDESNEDRSKRQKVTHGAGTELEGLVMESERHRFQRYSDFDLLMQVKQNADIYLDRVFSNDHMKREIVKKELKLGVHPSVHLAEVFSSPRTARLVHRFGLTPGLAFDLRTGWDLNDPAQRAKMRTHLQHERPILIVGSWSGHSAGTSHMRWMMDIFRWQVAQGRFFVHQYSGKVVSECRVLYNEIDFGVQCRRLEDVRHEL